MDMAIFPDQPMEIPGTIPCIHQTGAGSPRLRHPFRRLLAGAVSCMGCCDSSHPVITSFSVSTMREVVMNLFLVFPVLCWLHEASRKGLSECKYRFHTKPLIREAEVSLIMDILGSIVGIILAIVAVIIIYFLLKKVVVLVINAIVGVIVLFLLNLFHVMSLFGAPDLPIDWITILISAIGGLVGVAIVILLHLAGVAL
jgi:hypothetical protein